MDKHVWYVVPTSRGRQKLHTLAFPICKMSNKRKESPKYFSFVKKIALFFLFFLSAEKREKSVGILIKAIRHAPRGLKCHWVGGRGGGGGGGGRGARLLSPVMAALTAAMTD